MSYSGGPRADQPRRRAFTAEYKLAMVAEYDRAAPGQRGALPRRERLYHSHIIEWRKARDAGMLVAAHGAEQTETGRPPCDCSGSRLRTPRTGRGRAGDRRSPCRFGPGRRGRTPRLQAGRPTALDTLLALQAQTSRLATTRTGASAAQRTERA